METTINLKDTELKFNDTLVFGPDNPNWHPTVEYCVLFLRASQNYMNDLYKRRGFIFLNDLHDQLGFPRTGAGQVLGWIFGESEDVLIDWTPGDDGTFELILNPLGVIVDQIDAR